MHILIPVLSFGAIGIVVGIILAFASKMFAVEKDERIEQVAECLPGANCGGCGYAGCGALAEAIVTGGAKISSCSVANNESIRKIASIMGQTVEDKQPLTAHVRCSGTMDKANYKYYFDGSKSCKSVSLLQGGDKACPFACLGYGDCAQVCKFGALHVENGIAVVDEEKCTACGMCAKECPRGVIALLPKHAKAYVACSSKDKGPVARANCAAGCIGCGICAKNCPKEAITVTDFLAVIDQDKCIGCGICVQKCPRKIIRGDAFLRWKQNEEKKLEKAAAEAEKAGVAETTETKQETPTA